MPIWRKLWSRLLTGVFALGVVLLVITIMSAVAIVGIVSLPLWLPPLLIRQKLYERQLRRAARQFTCVSCQNILGDEAIRLSDEECAAESRARDEARKLRRKRGLLGLRGEISIRLERAICPHCGAKYSWD